MLGYDQMPVADGVPTRSGPQISGALRNAYHKILYPLEQEFRQDVAQLHGLSQQQQSQQQTPAPQGEQQSPFAPVHHPSLAPIPTAMTVIRGPPMAPMNLSEERADHLQHDQPTIIEKNQSQQTPDVGPPEKPRPNQSQKHRLVGPPPPSQTHIQQRRTKALVFSCNCSDLTRLALLSLAIGTIVVYVYC